MLTRTLPLRRMDRLRRNVLAVTVAAGLLAAVYGVAHRDHSRVSDGTPVAWRSSWG
jgi:hypothetical protein